VEQNPDCFLALASLYPLFRKVEQNQDCFLALASLYPLLRKVEQNPDCFLALASLYPLLFSEAYEKWIWILLRFNAFLKVE
jgi:hypothetical protein